MKKSILGMAVARVALAQTAQADFLQTWSGGFQNGGVIPDGSLTGWSDTHTVSGLGGAITDVNVTLSLSGGWNGDLYAYLVHNSGFAVLLNRVGRATGTPAGYGDAGMTAVVLNDAAATDIHAYGGGGVPSGSFQPDGRNISPLATVGTFDTASRLALLSAFNGMTDGNGSWTLFIADVSGGDVSQLTSWTLDIAAVPEPASWLEASVAVLFLGGAVGLYRLKGKKVQLPVAA
jgi:subtilisin-like proprotein convertase family protein